MRKLNIRALLAIGFAVLFVVVLGVSVGSYYKIGKLNELAESVRKDVSKRDLTVGLQTNFERQIAAMRGFLISGQEKYVDTNLNSRRDFDNNLQKLESLISTARGRELSAHLKDAYGAYTPKFDHAIELRRAAKLQEANDAIFNEQVSALRGDLSKAIQDLVDWYDQQKTEAYKQQDEVASSAEGVIRALSLAGLLIALATSTGIMISVSRNMANVGRIVHVLEEVTRDNLTVPDLEVNTEDEIGKACLALNEMKRSLRAMVGKIALTAEHLASASEELSSSASQQAQGAETQSDQTSLIATAMQEMSTTVTDVSNHSNQAAESSRKAADTARLGGTIVETALAAMRNIASSVSATAKKVEDLGKSSERIGQIIGVIDDIADQTNLLALNAAIEAARAGEQGRGFAVVADEVRKLAERTTHATKEVAQTIQTVQRETKLAVQAMEAGTHEVESGVKTTAEAGNALREIITVSEKVGEMITHIATAATEQSSASEEINGNMEQIAKLVKQSSDGAKESAKACQELSGLAFDLQKIVSSFQLGEGATGGPINRSAASSEPRTGEARRARAMSAGAH